MKIMSPRPSNIVNAEIAAAAAIDYSKLALLPTSFTASEDLRNSDDGVKSTSNAGYTKIKEVRIDSIPAGLAGIRIKFDLQGLDVGHVGYGKIYRNGGAIGTERSKSGTGYSTFSEDFDASAWAVNDLIQVYCHCDGVNNASVQNFRFFYLRRITTVGTYAVTTVLDITVAMATTNQDP